MTVYTCERVWESMLTCIFEAWSSGLGHKRIRLELEPIGQYTMFDEYIHVDRDEAKAVKVMDAVNLKIGSGFYSSLAYSSMAYEDDVLDNIYRMMILGFANGERALDMMQYRDVMRHNEIRKRVGGEVCHFREFLRFHEIAGSVYVAHIEPKSRIVYALAQPFADRMPSEHWMIIDDIHREAVIHPKNEHYYLRTLTEDEFKRLLLTEEKNDEYTDMWKVFFDTIAIKERINPRCQRNLFPIWTRQHAVEFNR